MYKPLYPHLFEPLRVKNITFKNRIFSAPNMINQMVRGMPTDYFIGFLEHKARGGACQVTLGENPVDERGAHTKKLDMSSEMLPLLAEIAQAIKENGAVASAELTHGGTEANPLYNTKPIIGPVGLTREDGVVVQEMDEEIMNEVADSFAQKALLFKLAGFDMVMVHCGHNWLLSYFLSPITNTRTDKYGASVENRMRFPLMVLRRVREAVGPDYPIEMRVSGSDRLPGGKQVEETIAFIKEAEKGLIDMVQVSSGVNIDSAIHAITSTFMEKAHNVDLSWAIKKAGVKIPVITVGAVMDPETAEEIIASGKADGVAMARALIADPDLPNKARLGLRDEITPCLRCINCSTSDDPIKQHMICSVNPEIGREGRHGFVRPKAKRLGKVLVLGGGPGGMKAAITAAEQGHEVTLCERTDSLGGLLKFTDTDALKGDLKLYKDYLVNRVRKLNIRVMLQTEVTSRLVGEMSPDALIVAAGSRPIVPPIKGAELCRHVSVVYDEPESAGDSVVIVGGGLVGCEVGLHLSKIGKKVTVLEMADGYAADANEMHMLALRHMIKTLGMTVITGARCTEMSKSGVKYVKEGEERELKADSVFYAVGMQSELETYLALSQSAPTVIHIGDCKKVGKVDGAVHDAYYAALSL